MADAETITAKAPTLPVETMTVPYYPDGFDIQTG
jgi:hypothetical protein